MNSAENSRNLALLASVESLCSAEWHRPAALAVAEAEGRAGGWTDADGQTDGLRPWLFTTSLELFPLTSHVFEQSVGRAEMARSQETRLGTSPM